MSTNLFTCHQPSRYGRRGQQRPKDLTALNTSARAGGVDTSARAGGAEISRSPQPSRINTSARAGGVQGSRTPQSPLLKPARHVAAALRHPRRPDQSLTGAVRQPSSLSPNRHSRASARAAGVRAPRPPQHRQRARSNQPGPRGGAHQWSSSPLSLGEEPPRMNKADARSPSTSLHHPSPFVAHRQQGERWRSSPL